MKKIIILLILCILVIPISVHAEEDLIPNATAGVLMEEETGTIIYEKEKRTPFLWRSILYFFLCDYSCLVCSHLWRVFK